MFENRINFSLKRVKMLLKVIIISVFVSEVAFTIYICYASYHTVTLEKGSPEYIEYAGTLINVMSVVLSVQASC